MAFSARLTLALVLPAATALAAPRSYLMPRTGEAAEATLAPMVECATARKFEAIDDEGSIRIRYDASTAIQFMYLPDETLTMNVFIGENGLAPVAASTLESRHAKAKSAGEEIYACAVAKTGGGAAPAPVAKEAATAPTAPTAPPAPTAPTAPSEDPCGASGCVELAYDDAKKEDWLRFGGNRGGGTLFSDACPAGSVVAGITGRASADRLVGIALRCRKLKRDGSLGEVSTLPYRGGSGGTPFEAECASGRMVTGHFGSEIDFGRYGLVCSTPTKGDRSELGPFGNGGRGLFRYSCRDGSVATAVRGGFDANVIHASLRCTPIRSRAAGK